MKPMLVVTRLLRPFWWARLVSSLTTLAALFDTSLKDNCFAPHIGGHYQC